MKGLWLEGGEITLRDDLPAPQPAAGEVLVRVVAAGICNTDLELVRGYYPFTGVLGHEFVGVVESEGSGLAGQRVAGEINAVCHRCPACRAGRERHCERRTVLGIADRDGAFAEYLTLPEENLYPLPAAVTTAAGTFVEPLAAALEIQEQVRVAAGDRVLVVGDGKLGQLVVATLAATGCVLDVAGRHARKLALAERAGARALAGEPPRAGYDLVVEVTGSPAGFAAARRAVRPRGTLVLKSTYAGELTFDASALVVDEVTLVGSRCGPFAKAIELLAGGRADVEALIDARLPLARAVEAMARAAAPGVLKVLLEME